MSPFFWRFVISLYQIARRLTGLIPETPLTLAQDAVAKALGFIYDQTDWSFQKGLGGWLAPGVIFNSGSTTTTPYSTQVIGDATTTAMIQAYTGQPFLTQLQYRNPAYAIYDIVAVDTGADPVNSPNYPFATLTLDRPWMEPTSGPGQPYMIYQVYFVAPVQDFRKFVSIQDMTNDQSIDFWTLTQMNLADLDPQRQNFSNPTACVPAGIDQRPGSSTAGWQRFELWPQQGNYVPYTLNFRRRGPIPQSIADYQTMNPPYPVTEEMVEWRAREVLCQFKEAQKDRNTARGAGANWMLLSQMAQKEYALLLGQAISIDLNIDGESVTTTSRRQRWPNGSPYATMGGRLNLGGYGDC